MAQPRNPPPEPEPQPEPQPQPQPEPAPAPSDEPDWARSLRETIEGLPGKLRASVTDDDRKSIAEHVHGLFERSGAFEKPEREREPEQPADPEKPGPPPERREHEEPPRKRTLAERMGFPAH